jgi:hypothetical protein
MLIHTLHDAVEFRLGEQTLFRYVYEPPEAQVESPRPYFHPLRTLAGNEVTLYRPHDHVWHKGLSMTCAQLSGHNFWGGATYVPGQGYVQLNNNGRIRHRKWEDIQCDEERVDLHEALTWCTADGDTWLREKRRISAREFDASAGYWALDLEFRLENVRGAPLIFGSPTTRGRPMAGYGGLFWRGPRSFLGGTVLAGGGLEGPEVMGRRAPWLAYTGAHDGRDAQSTLVFIDRPGNAGYPNKWFVRNDPYPGVCFSFMFDEEYALAPDDELVLAYRIVIADGAWTRHQIESYLGG